MPDNFDEDNLKDSLEQLNKQDNSKTFSFNTNTPKRGEEWKRHSVGTKFRDKEGWWVRTNDGRRKLDEEEDSELLQPAIPTFCPECGRIMNKDNDRRAYMLRKHCFVCHVDEHAEKDKEPNRKLIEKKLKEKGILEKVKDGNK